MPPDQVDLFASMPPPRRPAVARPVSSPVVPAPPAMGDDELLVADVRVPVDQVERELNRLHRSVTGALAYRNTLCVTARDLAMAAMTVDHLKSRAMRVLKAWQDQEVALMRGQVATAANR